IAGISKDQIVVDRARQGVIARVTSYSCHSNSPKVRALAGRGMRQESQNEAYRQFLIRWTLGES
ncbi:MAG: hypothetical protein WCS20_16475, partial [Alphaproteobacteria bacterium]